MTEEGGDGGGNEQADVESEELADAESDEPANVEDEEPTDVEDEESAVVGDVDPTVVDDEVSTLKDRNDPAVTDDVGEEMEVHEAENGGTEDETDGQSVPSESDEERGDATDEGPDASESEADGEVEPVELLVDLAERGEIDPWDIDIVSVTDRFLEALEETDLRTTGRALFYASVLLRMKSDELFSRAGPATEEPEPWGPDGDMAPAEDVPLTDPVASLEAEMERRLDRKHARGKPETLDELVRELREAERGSWWKDSRSYDTSESPSGFHRGVQELSYRRGDEGRIEDEPTTEDVTHTTHAEEIDAVIDAVEAALFEHYDRGREEVLYAEIRAAGGSSVMTYLALLFLAHRGRIRLEQDELFGDLWIQQTTPEAEPAEALAD